MENKNLPKYSNFRDAKEITLLKIEVNEGEGIMGDPIRRVAYLVTKTGRVVAKIGETVERSFAGGDGIVNLD